MHLELGLHQHFSLATCCYYLPTYLLHCYFISLICYMIFLLNPFTISSLDPQKWLVYVWTWCNVESDTISSINLRLVKPARGLCKVDRHFLTHKRFKLSTSLSLFSENPTARLCWILWVLYFRIYISIMSNLGGRPMGSKISLVIQLRDYDLVPVVSK